MLSTWTPVVLEIFKSIRFQLKVIGILKFDTPTKYQGTVIVVIQRTIILLCIFYNCLSSIWFVFLAANRDKRNIINSCIFVCGYSLLCIWYLYALYYRAKIEYFVNRLQQIVEQRTPTFHSKHKIYLETSYILFHNNRCKLIENVISESEISANAWLRWKGNEYFTQNNVHLLHCMLFSVALRILLQILHFGPVRGLFPFDFRNSVSHDAVCMF